MSSERTPSKELVVIHPHWGVKESVLGFASAVILMWLLVRWLTSGVYYDGYLALILSYAVVWVPLLGASLFACFISGTRSLSRDLGLRFLWIDALFGVGVGLLARAVASLVEIGFYGHMNGLGVTFGEVVYDGWWLFGAILAPIFFAPFVEELFFRGLVQRTTLRLSSRLLPAGISTAISILVSATLFTVLHLAEVTNPVAAAVLGLATLVLGIGCGILVALTGRLGGSIVAHITFNGSLVLAALLA